MSFWGSELIPVGTGFAVVLIGILWCRLHAFLALILAAMVTAALTPFATRIHNELEQRSHEFSRQDEAGNLHGSIDSLSAVIRSAEGQSEEYKDWVPVGDNSFLLIQGKSPNQSETSFVCPRMVYTGEVDPLNDIQSSDFVFDAPSDFRPHPGDQFLLPEDLYDASEAASRSVPQRVTEAFGKTVGSIGILIAFAAIIGMCLLESGAADRIVRSALKLVGERGAPVGFAGSGFLLAIPVFFDTVFFLMIPLGKALRLRTGRNYILYILTIFCGATMAHSLVPPTPGPLLVAEQLHVEVGLMMLAGMAVGLVTASYGIVHALIVNRWMDIPLRDTPDLSTANLQKLADKPDAELPPLWLSLLPILVPVGLIGLQTVMRLLVANSSDAFPSLQNSMPTAVLQTINLLGEKNVALGVGMVIGLGLLIWQAGFSLAQIRDRVGGALAAGGSIILITAAGGAFGKVLAETGIARLIHELPTMGTVGTLCLAFFVTTLIRTMQGSATVAMITAVGLFAGVSVPFHPVWLALAIGCGSKPISWMNDSGFWVIGRMSGMTEAETLKTLTPMTIMMGLVGLLTVIVGATLFPMA